MGNTTSHKLKLTIEPGVYHMQDFESFETYIEELN